MIKFQNQDIVKAVEELKEAKAKYIQTVTELQTACLHEEIAEHLSTISTNDDYRICLQCGLLENKIVSWKTLLFNRPGLGPMRISRDLMMKIAVRTNV